MGPSEVDVRAAVSAVDDPDLRRGVDELGMVRGVQLNRRSVTVELAVPSRGWTGRDELVRRTVESVGAVSGVSEVQVVIGVMDDHERTRLLGEIAGPNGPNRFTTPGTKTRVVAVSSGKGGVGKSSVTVNLAIALAARGFDVGLLDADVYGFSVPAMMGVERGPAAIDTLLVPPVVHGVRCLSMGFFVDDEQPVIWRGPMLHKALEQFLVDAYWGEPDFLLVDMPPGTGDVALSMSQYVPRTEVVVVTTPQSAAGRVAQRAAFAAKTLKLPVRGVIENLSWFTGDDGKRYELFGRGGGTAIAEALGVPLLGQIPLVPALRVGGDEGVPVVVSDPGGEAAASFDALAARLVDLGPTRIYRRELSVR